MADWLIRVEMRRPLLYMYLVMLLYPVLVCLAIYDAVCGD
jgi:hypothetical protein